MLLIALLLEAIAKGVLPFKSLKSTGCPFDNKISTA